MSVWLKALKAVVVVVDLSGWSEMVRQMPLMEEPLDSCACLACSFAMAVDHRCSAGD